MHDILEEKRHTDSEEKLPSDIATNFFPLLQSAHAIHTVLALILRLRDVIDRERGIIHSYPAIGV
jgi:hypothetical protein